jgi:hypothetical protein
MLTEIPATCVNIGTEAACFQNVGDLGCDKILLTNEWKNRHKSLNFRAKISQHNHHKSQINYF